MKTSIKSINVLVLVCICIVATIVLTSNHSKHPTPMNDIISNKYISIVEIPATDLTRAREFYQSLLAIKIEVIHMEGMDMGLFPVRGDSPSVLITKGDGYEPSSNGPLVYLDGGNDLQLVLDKVTQHGGQVVLPKTLIDEENGYFALFLDTEGNKLGIHSKN